MTIAQRLFQAGQDKPCFSQSSARAPRAWLTFDKPLLWVVMSLLMLGMIMVYSASIALPGIEYNTLPTSTRIF